MTTAAERPGGFDSMSIVRSLDWLGFGRHRISTGISLSSESATVAALRSKPLRIVALGRMATPGASVINDELRAVDPLAAVRLMRLAEPNGTSAMIAGRWLVARDATEQWAELAPPPGHDSPVGLRALAGATSAERLPGIGPHTEVRGADQSPWQ